MTGDAAYQLGLLCFQQGQAAEALTQFDSVLAEAPQNSKALIMRGLSLQALGRPDEALACYNSVLASEPGNATAYSNCGNALRELGRMGDALAHFDAALAIKPDLLSALNNRGNILLDRGRAAEALESFDKILAQQPGFAAALYNRSQALRALGRLAEALASCDAAIAGEGGNARMQSSRGLLLQEMGRLEEAIACHRQALAMDADLAEAWTALGNAAMAQGKLGEAEAAWRRSLASEPAAAENLGLLLAAQGQCREALEIITPLLQSQSVGSAGRVFAQCVQQMHFTPGDNAIRAAMVRALSEPWERPSELAPASAELIKCDPALSQFIGAQSFDDEFWGTANQNGLLLALLITTPNADIALERFLTGARRALLSGAEENWNAGLEFPAALARQCFINEYIFFFTEAEKKCAERLCETLSAALEAGKPVPAIQVAAAAAYFPLGSIASAGRLLERAWPAEIEALLEQQLRQPQEEARLSALLPRLTGFSDAVSQKVQAQYEENPYPRWVQSAPAGATSTVPLYLSRKFPLAGFRREAPGGDILIAGCGTGQHAIATSQKFPGANILAVDLSAASLAYARRKANALGLANLDYAQADLLELGGLARRFDVIEAVGVLHHLADPFAGWRILLSLLRPGGFMMLGLYSALARRDIGRARDLARNYPPTPDGIRLYRQMVMAAEGDFAPVHKSPDFFSLSSCRDLLFHVQEHCLSLGEIAAFLAENGLIFLGFELNGDILSAYRQRFANDPGATDLGQWQDFEKDNPDSFAGMYQFWVQKSG